MSAVEDRIVAMKFDNKQFEPAARTTMSTLDRLKAALNFSGSNKGLNDLQASANKFSLNGLTNSASNVSGKFLAMASVAVTAIANIVNRAVDAGIRIANAFTLAPLKQGFQEYETQLGSVQTILANTQSAGNTLKDVNRTLDELNEYSDKTIYNFGEMAKNIGTFTAAGVDLDTSTAAIKGIANLAALSGSNSQQAASAMYQLSQALSAGRVSLQDWNSVVNAGMGGTVFQRALAQTAERMGTLEKGAVTLTGKMKNATINGKSFRESITAKPGEESWLTSEVLTATLKQFTGDMSDAELATMGFTKAQIKSIQEQAKTAQDAATQVKTFTQLVGTLQESAGSGWAQTFEILLGDFEEAKKLWTDVNNVLGGFIGKSAEARNKMLTDWKELGGRTAALKGLQNIFKAIVSVITPIAQAFREIFPQSTGKQLLALTKTFLNFTKTLKIGAGTAEDIRRTFAGVFAIFSIGWSVIKALLGILGDLFGLATEGSGAFLNITGNLGDFLVKLDQGIKKGGAFNKFFETLGNILSYPVAALNILGGAVLAFFSALTDNPLEAVSQYFGRLQDRLDPLSGTADRVSAAWNGLMNIFRRIGQFLEPAIEAIQNAFSGIGEAIGEAFKAGDFNSVYDALNTGLFAGILLLIRKFMSEGISIDFGGSSGLVGGIKDTFGALTDTLSAMQTQIQSRTLLTIAGAIALLTASVVALSLIDSAKLSKALTAMSVSFGQLLLAMAILTKISGAAGFVKVPMIAGAMILLATAVLILTAAVKNLSDLDWEELSKGLVGVGALLGMIVLTSAGLDKAGGSMLRAGIAMIPLAIGIRILASAVESFSDMTWGEMAKGLTALAGSLVIIAGAIAIMPPSMILQAAGLVVLSIALKGIGSALQDMGGMTWGEIAKGLTMLAASLLILAGGLYLMSATLPGSAGLLIAAAALAVLAPVLRSMGELSWEDIAKGLTTLAGSLLILAGGLTLMSGTLAGSAALLIAAGALTILTPVLVTLGAMSWESIAKGMAAIAGAFLVLGVSALVLAPLIPIILGLSAALLLLGVSFTLIGVGALAIATAFSIFAAAGTASMAILIGMINLIPQFLSKFAEGIVGFATTLASQADKFTKAFASLLSSLLDAVILILPKVGKAFNLLIGTALNIIVTNAPKLAAAALLLLMTFLRTIEQNIGRIVVVAGNIIINFLRAMATKIPQIVKVGTDLMIRFMQAINSQRARLLQAAASMIISYINQLATTIRNNASQMRQAGLNLATAIIDGMTGGLASGAWRIVNAAASAARSALAAAMDALGAKSPSKRFEELGKWSDEGLAIGFDKYAGVVERSATNTANTALEAVRRSMSGLSGALSEGVDFDPVITPILDLSQITRDASRIGGMLDQKAISAELSYRQAMGISNDRQPTEDVSSNIDTAPREVNIKYEQINNSPRALSSIEIYRQTKDQLSLVKEAIK